MTDMDAAIARVLRDCAERIEAGKMVCRTFLSTPPTFQRFGELEFKLIDLTRGTQFPEIEESALVKGALDAQEQAEKALFAEEARRKALEQEVAELKKTPLPSISLQQYQDMRATFIRWATRGRFYGESNGR